MIVTPARFIAALLVQDAAFEEWSRLAEERRASERAAAAQREQLEAVAHRRQRILLGSAATGLATLLVAILAGAAANSGWASIFVVLLLGSTIPVVPSFPDEGGWVLWVPLGLSVALGIIVGVVVNGGVAILTIATYAGLCGVRVWRGETSSAWGGHLRRYLRWLVSGLARDEPAPGDARAESVDPLPWVAWTAFAFFLTILFATHA